MYDKKVKEMVTSLVPNINKTYFEDDMKFQVIGAYLFGMLNGLALDMSVDPSEVETEMINVLMNIFYYNESYAIAFTKHLVKSTSKEYHPSIYAIIHRGMKGYNLIKENQIALVVKDLDSIIKVIESFNKDNKAV